MMKLAKYVGVGLLAIALFIVVLLRQEYLQVKKSFENRRLANMDTHHLQGNAKDDNDIDMYEDSGDMDVDGNMMLDSEHPYPKIDPSSQHKYMVFQEKSPHRRRIIKPELVYQFLPKHADPNRYLIYYCHGMCGGLADRQKGMVAAYIISLLTNRTFGINVTQPTEFTQYYQPNLVNWVIDPTKLAKLSTRRLRCAKEVASDFYKKKLDKFFPEDVVQFQTNIDWVTPLRKHPLTSKLLPAMMFLQDPDVYSIILHILLKLQPSIQERLDSFIKNKVGNRHLVCAHVRMGKNPTMADVTVKLKMEQTESMWPFFDKYKNPSKYATYIAGDSNELRAIAKRKYGSQALQVPGTIAHISRKNYTMINMTREEANVIQREAMIKVVLEQNILHLCDTIMISRSGFNLMAVYQRNHSENLYCMVKERVLPCIRELVYNVFILF